MVGFEYNVYSHTSPSGKKYIGITKQKPEHRWSNGDGYKRHPYFYNAIKKHGWDKMEHVVLFTGLSEQEAKEKEAELIALYDTTNPALGYNISSGGESGANGVTRSEETRRKLSIANKGKTMSEEAKIKIGIANKGKIVSKETRLKQSIANKGQIVSQETRKKLSEAMTGKQRPPCSEETREKLSKAMKGKSNREGKYMRKIACTNIETGEELKFDNISNALSYIKDNVYPQARKKTIYQYCRYCMNGYKHKWRYEGI